MSTTDDELVVDLVDGRRLAVPLAWFPRLLHATPQQRARYELLGDGEGIHWPEVDEDVSVAALLEGLPSREAGGIHSPGMAAVENMSGGGHRA